MTPLHVVFRAGESFLFFDVKNSCLRNLEPPVAEGPTNRDINTLQVKYITK